MSLYSNIFNRAFCTCSPYLKYKTHTLVNKSLQTFSNICIKDLAYRFCIIGSGPAGFHMAKQILKDIPNSQIDIFDKMPFPFGLIRTGVAPDHQDVKKILREFTRVGDDPQLNFYGNVEIGNHIPLEYVKNAYTGVIFAYGAEDDKQLKLKNEESLKGIYAARAIVNWYNSHPDYTNSLVNQLKEHSLKNMVIIGNGNVAIDVARIFSKHPDELKLTDVNDETLEILKERPTENIFIVGRRGVVQSAYTTKTLRELINLNQAEVFLLKDEYEESMNEISIEEIKDKLQDPLDVRCRQNKRKLEVLKLAHKLENQQELQKLLQTKPNKRTRIIFRYLMSPCELIGNDGKIDQIVFDKNYLTGKVFNQSAVKNPVKLPETIKCDVLLRSIGYKSRHLSNVVFDFNQGIIPNSNGCLLTHDGSDMIEVGLYAAGWIKTGPIGVIDTTLKDSIESFVNLKQHYLKGYFRERPDPSNDIKEMLRSKNIRWIDFNDWKKIDKYELEMGFKKNKIRDKVKTRDEIFKILDSLK